jgi:hypothetical protein
VAAEALRELLTDPELSRETVSHLVGWAHDRDWRVRHVVARTCGGGSDVAPSGPALVLQRHLIRSSEEEPHPQLDRAMDDAMLDMFGRGDRLAVLKTLCRWTECGGPEAQYATHLLPKLLRRDLLWFEKQTQDDEVFGLIILLIRRTLRARGPGGALRDTVLMWRRITAWSPNRSSAVDAVLFAVGEDWHPHVRRFLNTIHRHG